MLSKAPILCDCTREKCDAYNTKGCLAYIGARVVTTYDCRSGVVCGTTTYKCQCSL